MTELQPGRYRHFKGNEYEVLGVARDSETMQEVVVYRALYGERGLWVRPLAMFAEEVERGGRRVKRFEYLSPLPVAGEVDATVAGEGAERS
jgi:hypothetical protein